MRSPKAIDVGLAQRPHVSVRFSRGHPTMLHGFPWGDSSKDLFEIAPGAPWSLKTLERAPCVDKSGADSFFFTISCFLTFLAGPSVTKYGLKGSVSFFPGKIKT